MHGSELTDVAITEFRFVCKPKNHMGVLLYRGFTGFHTVAPFHAQVGDQHPWVQMDEKEFPATSHSFYCPPLQHFSKQLRIRGLFDDPGQEHRNLVHCFSHNLMFQGPFYSFHFRQFRHGFPSPWCYFASYQVRPVLTSTFRGTASSTGPSITRRTRSDKASVSSSGTSKINSSCT